MDGPASIASLSRQVADLDRAVSFYEALGFERDSTESGEWESNEVLGRLYDTPGARWRSATMYVPSAVSGRPFPVVLREYAQIERRDWRSTGPWSLGAMHIGLGGDPYADWDSLEAVGELRPAMRHPGPVLFPQDLFPIPHECPPIIAIADADGLLIEIQPPRAARPPDAYHAEMRQEGVGFNHVNVNVRDMAEAQRFYELLGIEFPSGPYAWLTHPWLDDLFDLPGEGNSWKIVYGRLPEAGADGIPMMIEFIEFKEFREDVGLGTARYSDINITSPRLDVDDLERMHATLSDAGAVTCSVGGIVDLADGSQGVLMRDPSSGGFLEFRQWS